MGQRTYVWTVPVANSYEAFLRVVRQRVATRVASRTIGPDGRPLHREIELTQGNQSLNNTYMEIVSRGMQTVSIRACFQTSASGRVERITFSPPPVVPIAPTTITASPPRPGRRSTLGTRPQQQRPGRGAESEGEVAGIPGLLSGGRIFYGIHTTRHNTLCWGAVE